MSQQVTLSLRYLRRSADLTQEELASRLGVSRATVIKWEKGEHSPSSAHLRSLALILGVTVQVLLDALDGQAA